MSYYYYYYYYYYYLQDGDEGAIRRDILKN